MHAQTVLRIIVMETSFFADSFVNLDQEFKLCEIFHSPLSVLHFISEDLADVALLSDG